MRSLLENYGNTGMTESAERAVNAAWLIIINRRAGRTVRADKDMNALRCRVSVWQIVRWLGNFVTDWFQITGWDCGILKFLAGGCKYAIVGCAWVIGWVVVGYMGGMVMCAIILVVFVLMVVNVSLCGLIFRIVERLHDFREAAARLSGSGCTKIGKPLHDYREAAARFF